MARKAFRIKMNVKLNDQGGSHPESQSGPGAFHTLLALSGTPAAIST
jgi:hypothetical protein